MFPEGTFINEKNNKIIVFEKDTNNPEYEGFVCFWEMKDIDFKQLRFKKRLSILKAHKKYRNLLKEGWILHKNNKQVA
jgi:lipopolysaccharide export LptBFGC system permease protein LptF